MNVSFPPSVQKLNHFYPSILFSLLASQYLKSTIRFAKLHRGGGNAFLVLQLLTELQKRQGKVPRNFPSFRYLYLFTNLAIFSSFA